MKCAGVLFLTTLFAIPAFGGVVFEIEATNHEDGKTYETQFVAEGRYLKIGIPPGAEGVKEGYMVFRAENREMVFVDQENSTYSVIDEAAVRAISGQLSAMMPQMEEALKNVPQDQRAAVEKMMKQRMPGMPSQQPTRPRSQLRNTGEHAKHNGYPCVKYIVLQDGVKVREHWVTEWKNIEGSREVAATFEDMADFFSELLDSIPQFGGQQEFGDQSLEYMQELGGFPVVTRDFKKDGSLTVEATLRSAKRQTIDPDAFEPPSGYKRQEMFKPR